nr:immunoglobulin heavy chain junction region [Mus musculus]
CARRGTIVGGDYW